MSRCDVDVLVIGAGPAGSSVAIRLALAGWRVAVLEQSQYPRQKVCGECLGPASLRRLHELGISEGLCDLAGPELRRVAWMTRDRTGVADMPPCHTGPFRYGRAVGRDLLDALLLDRAREVGAKVIQPARARRLSSTAGEFVCEYRSQPSVREARSRAIDRTISASIVVDAHGSWERGPAPFAAPALAPARPADLLGFKATFRGAALPSGLLPVLALPGAYGGMVISDRGRATVACCIRRDVLRGCRLRSPGDSAGAAVEAFLRSSCRGLAEALAGARLDEGWQSIGPLRPGFHARKAHGVFSIGNAAAEAHPLIGEGICMALESAALLAGLLGKRRSHLDERIIRSQNEAYVRAMRATCAPRLRLAQLYSQFAMRERVAGAVAMLIQSWPQTLTLAAHLAGKARAGAIRVPGRQELT